LQLLMLSVAIAYVVCCNCPYVAGHHVSCLFAQSLS
jgi:hypothetical protein